MKLTVRCAEIRFEIIVEGENPATVLGLTGKILEFIGEKMREKYGVGD